MATRAKKQDYKLPGKGQMPGRGGSGGGSSGSSGGSSGSSGGGGYSQFQLQQMSRAYQNIANQYGFGIPPGAIQKWIHGGVSVSEVQQRFMTLQRIKEFQPWMNAFSDVLNRQHGIKWAPTFENIKNFMLNPKSEPQLYAIWGEAANEAQLRSAGIDIGPQGGKHTGQYSLNVSQAHQVEAAIGRDASIAGGGGKTYAEIADLLAKQSDADLTGIGFNKSDIITLATGGSGAEKLRQKWQQIELNAAAYSTQAQNVQSPLDQQTQQNQGYTPGSQ